MILTVLTVLLLCSLGGHAKSRVVSRNLFHYKPTGIIGAPSIDIAKLVQNTAFQPLYERAYSKNESIGCDAAVQFYRGFAASFPQPTEDPFKSSRERCVHTEIKIPICGENDAEVKVLIHTPKSLANKSNRAAFIFAHGGGAVFGSAEMDSGRMSEMALATGTVIFNVDYRLAPETTFPRNALDFYCTIKYVHENAQELGIDAEKIAISGESGGGYIVFAAMVLLAQKNESSMVKISVPVIPMISDYPFSDPLSMTLEEREGAYLGRKVWQCIAGGDINKHRHNPLLFPDKASDELISLMPPTIIWEMEFDMFITEATRMAHRMRRLGRLLEYRVQPGQTHLSWTSEDERKFYVDDMNIALKTYLFDDDQYWRSASTTLDYSINIYIFAIASLLIILVK